MPDYPRTVEEVQKLYDDVQEIDRKRIAELEAELVRLRGMLLTGDEQTEVVDEFVSDVWQQGKPQLWDSDEPMMSQIMAKLDRQAQEASNG